jgi:uncharacterized membrane protein
VTLLDVSLACGCASTCWICAVLAFVVGGFFGVMALAIVVSARDADDERARALARERDAREEQERRERAAQRDKGD